MIEHGQHIDRWRHFGVAFVVLILSACAGPTPPVGPVAASSMGTAVVMGGPADEVYFLGRGAVTVTRIDDTSLADANDVPRYRTVEVYPGLHDIHFVYNYAALCAAVVADCAITLSRPGRLALNALPGHVYRVTATYGNGSLRAWVIDETVGGQVVAGTAVGAGDWAASQQGIGSAHQF